MKEFTTIEELAKAKTREDIVLWAAEMQKCPYDYKGEAFAEDICKGGDDAEQCNECWRAALKDIKCKGDKKKKTDLPDPKLAAKDSNAGVLALKDLAKTITRAEFDGMTETICPNMYGFPDSMNGCNYAHKIKSQCLDCWKVIADGLEFADSKKETTKETSAILKELQHMNACLQEIKLIGCKMQADLNNVVKLLNEPTASK